MWSGQAEAFSDVVMSALHSRRIRARQSLKNTDSHAKCAYLTGGAGLLIYARGTKPISGNSPEKEAERGQYDADFARAGSR